VWGCKGGGLHNALSVVQLQQVVHRQGGRLLLVSDTVAVWLVASCALTAACHVIANLMQWLVLELYVANYSPSTIHGIKFAMTWHAAVHGAAQSAPWWR
jgi:hypothetical protein